MLSIESASLAVIDVQGKLYGLIHDHEKVQTHIGYFILAAKSFNLPVLWSEQAPDKIGETIKPIKDLLDPIARPIAKHSFSCYGEPAYVKHLQEINRRQILIMGIETHVCVYQTAHDLRQHGYEVHLVADATSSRKALDRDMAIARMRDEGMTITTTEMAMCELIKTADHPQFKTVVSHLKRR